MLLMCAGLPGVVWGLARWTMPEEVQRRIVIMLLDVLAIGVAVAWWLGRVGSRLQEKLRGGEFSGTVRFIRPMHPPSSE